MAKQINVEFIAKNLGPHKNLTERIQVRCLELGIFATNGSGKTFLSRAFRLTDKTDLDITDSNRLLTLGENSGEFKVKITNNQEVGVSHELSINLGKDTLPIINNNTNYLFRVFNDDYIRENLEELKYKPNGQIDGYILGKELIDLSKEKKELEDNQTKLVLEEISLKSEIEKTKNELKNFSVHPKTIEFKNFTSSNLLDPNYSIVESETFRDLVKKNEKLKLFPDNLQDLTLLRLLIPNDTLENTANFLREVFTKSSIAAEFKKKIKEKQSFIEEGLNLLRGTSRSCPFCEQKLGNEAEKLIDQYVEYLSETEAIQIKKSNDLRSQLLSDKKNYSIAYKEVLRIQNDFNKYQKFIPSLSDKSLSSITNFSALNKDYEILEKEIENKKRDISISISNDEIMNSIESINKWIIDFNKAVEQNNQLIRLFNTIKNDTTSEKLNLNRRLCNSSFNELKTEQKNTIINIANLQNKITQLSSEISKKEQQHKVLRKEKVSSTFKHLLNKFFLDKYSFDGSTFCLKFQNHLLETNASDVLSSGEKCVVAFCYFVAEAHRIIKNESDYEKLFFIIDDPISSQDFHFVYATSQIIRNLNKLFNIQRLRLLLLTHNLEFMSIVIRNKIIEQKFILSNNKISRLGNELIMPYEEHLRDVYEVSSGVKSPSHTTPNSIRHILETICHFVSPDISSLEEFCKNVPGYSENEFLYSLIQDGSHGGIRMQKATTDDMVRAACEVVIDYVSNNFEGQIKVISAQ